MAKLFHPDVKTTIEVPDASVPVLEKSGWTTKIPKKYEGDEPSNPVSAEARADQGKEA